MVGNREFHMPEWLQGAAARIEADQLVCRHPLLLEPLTDFKIRDYFRTGALGDRDVSPK